jgi:carboxyl-terminal processing protease
MRFSVLLLLIVFGQSRAEAAAMPFNQERMVAVYAEALGFIAPRILDPVSIPQLTFWGLQSLTAIDPNVLVAQQEGRIQLFYRQRQLVLAVTVPKDLNPLSWARTALKVTVASVTVSAPIRKAGTLRLIQGFFDEMFSRLDPYSRYIPPVEAGEDRAQRAGSASLGITIGQIGRTIEILNVVRDSPASIAGLHPGDILVAVDDQRTQDQDLETIGALLTGPEGSTVALTWRAHDGRIRDAQLTRVMVPPETVFAQRFADVLVLRITSFSASTSAHIGQSVQDALSGPHKVDGIVLDLRDNRGGLLRQAVTAADAFLPAGVVATTIGRDPEANHIWQSVEGELAENVPLVVLVNGRTASAAEILAASLADRGRAVVVGSETVGKGLVQTIDPLPDGGELFVTWSRVLAPLGWPLQGLGVLPQVCTSLGGEALSREMAALSTGFQPMADAIRRERAARAPVPVSQELEIRAACPASEGRAVDLETARALIANPAAYAAALLPPMEYHP